MIKIKQSAFFKQGVNSRARKQARMAYVVNGVSMCRGFSVAFSPVEELCVLSQTMGCHFPL